MTACPELYQLNYETTVRLFDGISNRHDIPIIQFNTIASSYIDCDTLYNLNGREILSSETNVLMEHGHPNEKGHQIIADSLIKIIDKYII